MFFLIAFYFMNQTSIEVVSVHDTLKQCQVKAQSINLEMKPSKVDCIQFSKDVYKDYLNQKEFQSGQYKRSLDSTTSKHKPAKSIGSNKPATKSVQNIKTKKENYRKVS